MNIFQYIFAAIFLSSQVSAITFDCRFLNHSFLVIGSAYACEARLFKIFENRALTEVTGQHLSGRNDSNVQVIITLPYLGCNDLYYIPQNVTDFFPNLIGLDFMSCNIQTLNSNDLIGYPRLRFFDLMANRVARIPGDFFESTADLQFIGLDNNRISQVGHYLLDHLADLERALFYGNVCVNFDANMKETVPWLIAMLRNQCSYTD
jgi:hypothetical protein